MRLSNGFADPNVARLTVTEAPATINWLLGAGLVPLPGHPEKGGRRARRLLGGTATCRGAGGRSILAVIHQGARAGDRNGRITLATERESHRTADRRLGRAV